MHISTGSNQYIFNSDRDIVLFAIFHISNARPQRLQIFVTLENFIKHFLEDLTNVINKHFIDLSLGDIRFIQLWFRSGR